MGTGGFSNALMAGNTDATVGRHGQQSIMVPLQFWFCRNPGLALPLIALQYHEVKVIVSFQQVSQINNASDETLTAKLWVDYIYLDTDERRRFAQQSHEYLIEQLQYQTQSAATTTFDLNFNHPVKELIFAGLPNTS